MSQPADPRQKSPLLITLQRGLQLLETVAEENGEATAKQLSQRIDAKLGTCYQLLRTLQEAGYVVRLPGGRYGLSGRVAFLQDRLQSRLTPDPELLSLLRHLHEQVHETVYLSGWYGDDIVIQWCLEGQHTIHARSLRVGYSQNPHARASGKAILAFLPESRVRAYFAARGLPRVTAHTITDLDALLGELAATARRGYALDREEIAPGVYGVAAAYFDHRAFPVGAYVVAAPKERFDARRGEFARAVMDAARQASERLGWSGAYPPQLSYESARLARDGATTPLLARSDA
jgi:IclR family acetate operon transcriptional repressor